MQLNPGINVVKPLDTVVKRILSAEIDAMTHHLSFYSRALFKNNRYKNDLVASGNQIDQYGPYLPYV